MPTTNDRCTQAWLAFLEMYKTVHRNLRADDWNDSTQDKVGVFFKIN
jgi:hypothetical protein